VALLPGIRRLHGTQNRSSECGIPPLEARQFCSVENVKPMIPVMMCEETSRFLTVLSPRDVNFVTDFCFDSCLYGCAADDYNLS